MHEANGLRFPSGAKEKAKSSECNAHHQLRRLTAGHRLADPYYGADNHKVIQFMDAHTYAVAVQSNIAGEDFDRFANGWLLPSEQSQGAKVRKQPSFRET